MISLNSLRALECKFIPGIQSPSPVIQSHFLWAWIVVTGTQVVIESCPDKRQELQ